MSAVAERRKTAAVRQADRDRRLAEVPPIDVRIEAQAEHEADVAMEDVHDLEPLIELSASNPIVRDAMRDMIVALRRYRELRIVRDHAQGDVFRAFEKMHDEIRDIAIRERRNELEAQR